MPGACPLAARPLIAGHCHASDMCFLSVARYSQGAWPVPYPAAALLHNIDSHRNMFSKDGMLVDQDRMLQRKAVSHRAPFSLPSDRVLLTLLGGLQPARSGRADCAFKCLVDVLGASCWLHACVLWPQGQLQCCVGAVCITSREMCSTCKTTAPSCSSCWSLSKNRAQAPFPAVQLSGHAQTDLALSKAETSTTTRSKTRLCHKCGKRLFSD